MVFGTGRKTNQPLVVVKGLTAAFIVASTIAACGDSEKPGKEPGDTTTANAASSAASKTTAANNPASASGNPAENKLENKAENKALVNHQVSSNMLEASVSEAAAPAGITAAAAIATVDTANGQKNKQGLAEEPTGAQVVSTTESLEIIPGDPLMTYTLQQNGQTSSLQAVAIGANKTITANEPMATVSKSRATSTAASTEVIVQTSGSATALVYPVQPVSDESNSDKSSSGKPQAEKSTEKSAVKNNAQHAATKATAGGQLSDSQIERGIDAAVTQAVNPQQAATVIPTAEQLLPGNDPHSVETVVVTEETSALVSISVPVAAQAAAKSLSDTKSDRKELDGQESGRNPSANTTLDNETTASKPTAIDTTTVAEQSQKPVQATFLPIYDANTLNLVCDAALQKMEAAFTELGNSDIASATVESVLHTWNTLIADFENSEGPLYLQTYVSPDAAVREAGEACIVQLGEFNTGLFQRRDLYERVKAVVTSDPHSQAMRKDLLNAFDDNGIGLPAEKQERLKALKKEIQELSQAFSRTVRENDTKLTFGKDELKGLPESYLQRVGQADDGSITVGFDYPDVFPFLNNAESETARQRYLTAFSRRGTTKNLTRLDKIMQLRKELAGLFDLPSYAHLITQRRMVENPETVTSFLDTVENKLREVELNDVAQLRSLKAKLIGKPENSVQVQQWDKSYLKEQLRKERFSIDQEALRKNFPMPAVVDWGLWVASDLYGITFKKKTVPLWQADVLYYDVTDTASGAFLGGIYLDLYPRDGKYKHAAAFGVRGGSKLINRRPISVLVTNFDRKGLTHNELETFLHELGHVFHGVLTQTDYLGHAGTSVKRDFVEAPSQMFEAWARSPDTLSKIPDFCDGCPALDAATIERLNQARNFGSGLDYSRQHLYASYDMRLAGESPEPSLQTWYEMEGSTPLGVLPGGEFPGAFGHIAGGYAAGYYGYMWSEVLAIDMLSAFGDNLMDPAVGKRFRDIILGEGGQRPPKELVTEFLQREPNPAAFFAEITGNGQ